jgi:hypothetical protein
MRDQKTILDVKNSLAPAGNRTATTNGSSADLQAFDAATIVFHAGTITDGTHTPKVQDSSDDSTWTDVAAADLVGTLANITSNSLQRVGYIGSKRYVRAVVTVSSASTGGSYTASVIRGHSIKQPVA